MLCLVVLAALMAACGNSGSTTTSTSAPSTSAPSTSAQNLTFTITEKTGGHDIYSFAPQTVTIKAGTTVKWVNDSDENHLLASSPSGLFTGSSMVLRSGSNDNTYQITFANPGTYTITSTLVNRQNNQPEGMSSSATSTIIVTQ
jgi:plastocyanin